MPLDCPFCHHQKYSVHREKQELQRGGFRDIVRCNECGLLYPYMPMAEEEIQAHVSSIQVDPGQFPFSLQSENLIAHIFKDVEKHGQSLDIGTFNGRLPYLLQDGKSNRNLTTCDNRILTTPSRLILRDDM